MGFFTEQRVVVTGLGIVAPNAIGKTAFWDSLMKGTGGTKLITRFDTSDYHSKIAGEISDVHDVMVAVEKATTSFQLLMELRNKFLDAYQEVKRMQI